MKKVLKWFLVFMAVLFLVGIIAAIFETDEQAAARELDTKNKEAAAAQAKAEKLQARADKQAAKDKAKEKAEAQAADNNPLLSLMADNQPDPTIGGKTRMEVLVECQTAIQKQLSNPRSFKTKAREIIHKKYEDGGEHLVGFKFYAKNQFNAESEHMAVCAFDATGKRLTAEYK